MSGPLRRLRPFCLAAILFPAACRTATCSGGPQEGPSAPAPAPSQPFSAMPVAHIDVDLKAGMGASEPWRHSPGHGGINARPLPDRVVRGAAALRPRLIRIFIQEFFAIYPERGRFDWSRLDPYMDAMARTGAKVVAAITIKPKALFPRIDPSVWRPADAAEWRRVVSELVKRYSVERPIVTHWEVGNETDIGESGGCPYLIKDPDDYTEYYRMTIEPILAAFPAAKVGGPAVADGDGALLPGFIRRCREGRIRLDFVSWHLYADDPRRHARLVEKYKGLLEGFPGGRPELFVTEWNKGFDPVSVEELAFEPRRAAAVGATLIAMTEAGVDRSFYYHLWDQVCDVEDFRPFFRDPGIMYRHWNEVPHRFGLFGEGREARPQFFVYRMLGRMEGERVRARSDQGDLRVLAARVPGGSRILVVNYGLPASRDRIATLRLEGLAPGRKRLQTERIDRGRGWSSESLELLPLERREVVTAAEFSCQVYSPADSVLLLSLEEIR
jgi:xylan 1,4-beta-xylosidase